MRWEVLVKAVWLVVFTLVALIGGYVLVEYQGSAWVYLLFTALSLMADLCSSRLCPILCRNPDTL